MNVGTQDKLNANLVLIEHFFQYHKFIYTVKDARSVSLPLYLVTNLAIC